MKLHTKVFLFGIFLLPFEGLPIRISYGWNAVALLPFFASALIILISDSQALTRVLINVDAQGLQRIYTLSIFLPALSLIGYLLSEDIYLAYITRASIAIVFGIAFLFSFSYCLLVSKLRPSLLLRCLFSGYLLAICAGLLQFFAINFPLIDLLTSSSRIAGRVGVQRVSFMFSEPSFSSVHMSGVMIPFLILLTRRQSQVLIGSFLITGFLLINVVSGSSIRIILELGLLFLTLMPLLGFNHVLSFLRSTLLYRPFLYIIATLFFVYILRSLAIEFSQQDFSSTDLFVKIQDNFNYIQNRIKNIFQATGVDYSGLIRRLRVDMVVRTMMICPAVTPWQQLFGVGFGNLPEMTIKACPEVFAPYGSLSGFGEYQAIIADPALSNVFSMPARLLGEFGLLGVIFITIILFPRTRLQWLTAAASGIALLGFDSYAFYAIWIYAFTIICPYGIPSHIYNSLSMDTSLLLKPHKLSHTS